MTVKYEEAEVQSAAPNVAAAVVAPPPHWHEWLALIEKMREGRDAPVDMMGAGRAISSHTYLFNRNPARISEPFVQCVTRECQ
jgi:hypothetical protein